MIGPSMMEYSFLSDMYNVLVNFPIPTSDYFSGLYTTYLTISWIVILIKQPKNIGGKQNAFYDGLNDINGLKDGTFSLYPDQFPYMPVRERPETF